ncbi:MAG: exodeoxyribonuclease VII large subunit, partial [Alphaproteobacteria bacterium]
LDDAYEKLSSALWKRLDLFQQTWERLNEALRKPDSRLELARVQLEQKMQRLQQNLRFCLQQKIQRFCTAAKVLESVSYTKTLERGFCIITAQNEGLKSRAEAIVPGSQILIHFADGQVEAQALNKVNLVASTEEGNPSQPTQHMLLPIQEP